MSDERAMPNPYPWPTDLPPERAILIDLIEELRGLSGDGGTLFLVDEALDRAEARLREAADTDGAALPLHRTEAGWPRCATCDGGGCHDCTDPT